MRTYIKETRQVEAITSVTCNKCGKEILRDENFVAGGAVTIDCGYGSAHDYLNCGNIVFDLCDSCIEDLLSELKHKV